jgi:hypothetical protein
MSGPPQHGGRSRGPRGDASQAGPAHPVKLGVRDRTRAVLKAFELQLV